MINTVHLFRPLELQLIDLLKSLKPSEWSQYAIRDQWTVKDVAAHLLDGNLRTVSIGRDSYLRDPPDQPFSDQYKLSDYLGRLNKDWILASRRLSPKVIAELLEVTGKHYIEYIECLNLEQQALFPVSWAGEEQSVNWFHVAREYTEKWHHQQQIREATNKPGIMTRELYYPVLDTFMKALPYTFRPVHAEQGTGIKVTVRGDCGGSWYLVKRIDWQLTDSPPDKIEAATEIDQRIAWRLFSSRERPESILNQVEMQGDPALAGKVLEMISVVA